MPEGLTPHRLALCALVRVFSAPAVDGSLSRVDRQDLALFLLEECLAADSFLEPSLQALEGRMMLRLRAWKETRRRLWQQLLEIRRSADSLVSFMAAVSEVLAMGSTYTVPPPSERDPVLLLQPSSALGVFVRLCLCSFEALPFEALCSLLSDLQCYLKVARAAPSALEASERASKTRDAPMFGLLAADASHALRRGRSGADASMGVRDSGLMDMDGVGHSGLMDMDGVRHSGLMDMDGVGRESLASSKGVGYWSGRFSVPTEAVARDSALSRPSHYASVMEELRAEDADMLVEDGSGAHGMDEPDGIDLLLSGDELQEAERQHPLLPDLRLGGLEEGYRPEHDEDEDFPEFLRPPSQLHAFLREKSREVQRRGLPAMDDAELHKLLSVTKRTVAPLHALSQTVKHARGSHSSAVESLRRFFDYSAGKTASGPLASPVFSLAPDFPLGRFQTALLEEGNMHIQAHRIDAAIVALNESVHMSQQSKDEVCLVHALLALCHLLSQVDMSQRDRSSLGRIPGAAAAFIAGGLGEDAASPLPTYQQRRQLQILLDHSLQRAADLGLSTLVAYGHVLRAKFFAEHTVDNGSISAAAAGCPPPRSFAPLAVARSLRLPAHLLNACLTSSVLVPSGSGVLLVFQPPSATSSPSVGGLSLSLSMQSSRSQGSLGGNTSSGKVGPSTAQRMDHMGLVASALLERTSVWELYGCPWMARACALTHVVCFQEVAGSEDLCCAQMKLLKLLAADEGPSTAQAVLADITSKGLVSQGQTCARKVCVTELELEHESSLASGKHSLALRACERLMDLASPAAGCDAELKAEAVLRRAQTLGAIESFTDAVDLLEDLFVRVLRGDHQLIHARILLLFASIHVQAGSAVSALPYALSCLQLAQALHLDGIGARATLLIAKIRLALEAQDAGAALSMLRPCLPIALHYCGCHPRGDTLLLVAKCWAQLRVPGGVAAGLEKAPGAVGQSAASAKRQIARALQEARQQFVSEGSLQKEADVHCLSALLYHSWGMVEEREAAARTFLACRGM